MGPFQHPEKLIPRFTTNLIKGEKIPLYKSSQFKREWIYVDDHNSAVEAILKKGDPGESYNIGTGEEKSVEQIADSILKLMGISKTFKKYVPDRQSHDKRYLLNTRKIQKELGWKPKYGFGEALDLTINWYKENDWWWRPLKKKAEIIYKKTKQT